MMESRKRGCLHNRFWDIGGSLRRQLHARPAGEEKEARGDGGDAETSTIALQTQLTASSSSKNGTMGVTPCSPTTRQNRMLRRQRTQSFARFARAVSRCHSCHFDIPTQRQVVSSASGSPPVLHRPQLQRTTSRSSAKALTDGALLPCRQR